MPEESVPCGVDGTVASPARIYDALLGGKENYTVDRQVAENLTHLVPLLPRIIRDNREFLGRAVRYLATEHDIRRFLDVGSGLPTEENVHHVAQAVDPSAQVVYADNDPMAVVHAQALMAKTPGTAAIRADLRDPADLLARPAVRDLLDAGEPVGLLLVAVVHFLADDEDPYGVVSTLASALPPGSFIVMSHATADIEQEYRREAEAAYRATSDMHTRTKAEVNRFFDGMRLVEPGVVWSYDWRPPIKIPDPGPSRQGFYAAVAQVSPG